MDGGFRFPEEVEPEECYTPRLSLFLPSAAVITDIRVQRQRLCLRVSFRILQQVFEVLGQPLIAAVGGVVMIMNLFGEAGHASGYRSMEGIRPGK